MIKLFLFFFSFVYFASEYYQDLFSFEFLLNLLITGLLMHHIDIYHLIIWNYRSFVKIHKGHFLMFTFIFLDSEIDLFRNYVELVS